MLENLAKREIFDVTEWEIKGQGKPILDASREEHRIAVELKAYAEAIIKREDSFRAANLPEQVGFDDFLKRAMPKIGKQVLRDRFLQFLRAEAEKTVDQQMKLFPRPDISREERIKQMAENEFELLEAEGLAAPTHYEHRKLFSDWWKKQDEGNPFNKVNKAKTIRMVERRIVLVKLLPKQKALKGFSIREWENAAADADLISSLGTSAATSNIWSMRVLFINKGMEASDRTRKYVKILEF